MTHNRLCLNIYAVGILVQIAAGLLLTNSWSRDVYTGRHFDELIADDNGHVTRNALLLLYSPSCDDGLHSNVMNHHQITDSHQMVFAKYDYISTPKYVWYHMDSHDDLRLRYQPQHCMQLLLFLNNTDILKPAKVYEVATWDKLSDVTREAQKVHFVIVNDFGRQIDISVESDVGDVKHNTTSEFKQERLISACVADIITVRQTRNARAIKLILVTRDMDGTKTSIAWTEPYVDEQVWRQETQKTFDEQLAQFKAFEYQLAQRYLHDLKQPSVVPVFTEFGYKIQRLPPFLLRPLYEHYDLRRQNTELIQGLGNAKYLNIPLEQAVKLQFSSVMKVIAQDWCDASLVLTKTSHFREHGPGFRSSTHLGNLASQVIGVYAVLKEDLNPSNKIWPLEVVAHDGIRRNITLHEGEMLLYEASSVMIGRPHSFTGEICVTFSVFFKPADDWQWRLSHDLKHYKFGSDVIEARDILATMRTLRRAEMRGNREEL